MKKIIARFNMNYKDQLKTSAWLRKKYDVMSRDNFVCAECLCDNSESRLEVHHIGYIKRKKAWEYPDFMLVTLCRECHQREHDNDNISKPKKIRQWIVKLLKPKK